MQKQKAKKVVIANPIFGPVPSRRLGISLGIDPIPYKTCTYNCVYCECGLTTILTDKREAFITAGEVIDKLKSFLENYTGAPIDFITFAGSGEPTLNSDIGKMISWIKANTKYKVAVITNGSLLWREDVQQDLMQADVVLPSLDAVDNFIFKKINRPNHKINLKKVIDGLISFRQKFKGELWLEILFVAGINDTDEHLFELKEIIKHISPDRIQLNTIDRPPPEKWAQPVSEEKLQYIKKFLGERAEIIAPFKPTKEVQNMLSNEELMIELLRRRPETELGISQALSMHINEVTKLIRILEQKGIIGRREFQGKNFYYVK